MYSNYFASRCYKQKESYSPSSPDSCEWGLFSSVDTRSGPNKCSLIDSLMVFWSKLKNRNTSTIATFLSVWWEFTRPANQHPAQSPPQPISIQHNRLPSQSASREHNQEKKPTNLCAPRELLKNFLVMFDNHTILQSLPASCSFLKRVFFPVHW